MARGPFGQYVVTARCECSGAQFQHRDGHCVHAGLIRGRDGRARYLCACTAYRPKFGA